MTPEPSQANIERAIEMLNEARLERWPNSAGVWELPNDHDHPVVVALARALDAHDADRRAFSEVAKVLCEGNCGHTTPYLRSKLAPFILPDPEPVEPVEIICKALGYDQPALESTIAKHGLKITEVGNG